MINTSKSEVILVNESDLTIGSCEKLLAHQKGLLHRAFSIFIFRKIHNQIELLLHKRAQEKYHCGGLWSNTCCSHPESNEPLLNSAKNRLLYEMGFWVELYPIGAFIYKAHLNNGLIEHEYDHVLIGQYNQNTITPNSNEVEDYQWLEINTLMLELDKSPRQYTPWLKQALQLIINQNLGDKLFLL